MGNILFLVQISDRSFGFDTIIEKAQQTTHAANVKPESIEDVTVLSS